MGPRSDASLPWAVVFPQAGDALARHPSQIYQFLLEGVTLFAILGSIRASRAPGTVGSLFLIFYGLLRIVGEVFREPEALYGYMPLGLSAGQWLSVPMIVIGVVCFVLLRRNKPLPKVLKSAARKPPSERDSTISAHLQAAVVSPRRGQQCGARSHRTFSSTSSVRAVAVEILRAPGPGLRVDPAKVLEAAQQYAATPTVQTLKTLTSVAEPPRQELLRG